MGGLSRSVLEFSFLSAADIGQSQTNLSYIVFLLNSITPAAFEEWKVHELRHINNCVSVTDKQGNVKFNILSNETVEAR